MPRLIWDSPEDRDYTFGLDRGVYYPPDGPAQAWVGLTSVEEAVDDVDARPRYQDGSRVGASRRPGTFSGLIEALTYPSAFDGQLFARRPKPFGFTYRVQKPDGYEIHLVYNVLISVSEIARKFEENAAFSWGFTTRNERIPDAASSSHLVVYTKDAYPETVAALEAVLYGDDETIPSLPSPEQVLEVFEENSILRIIDHGDGTWTAIGPDDVVRMLDDTTFEIDWPSVTYLDGYTYKVHSL